MARGLWLAPSARQRELADLSHHLRIDHLWMDQTCKKDRRGGAKIRATREHSVGLNVGL